MVGTLLWELRSCAPQDMADSSSRECIDWALMSSRIFTSLSGAKMAVEEDRAEDYRTLHDEAETEDERDSNPQTPDEPLRWIEAPNKSFHSAEDEHLDALWHITPIKVEQ